MEEKTVLSNRKASFDYYISNKEIAGVKLMGSEIKSLFNGKGGISEAFIWIDIENHAVWIKNMYIKNEINNAYSHGEFRERKLLMTKKQIIKWYEESSIKGMTILPLRGFFDYKNKFKIEIGLGKGKKDYDKRNVIKGKDIDKDTARELSN